MPRYFFPNPMKYIALKIDVDTYRGTCFGVPALTKLLGQYTASASFFFSLGKDCSGRESKRGSLRAHYDLMTRLYGCFLPAPNISKHCAAIMRATRDAGFETGIHAWNRVAWEKKIFSAKNTWVEAQMQQAYLSFADVFAHHAKAHAAPGFRMNRHALRLTQRMGFNYASDCRGRFPFIPVLDGELLACPQLPTTLPTLDETMALEVACPPLLAADRIIRLSEVMPGDHVFTLRAELEGMKLLNVFEHLLVEWKRKGYEIIALGEYFRLLDLKALPRHTVVFSPVQGRPGQRMTQGAEFLKPASEFTN